MNNSDFTQEEWDKALRELVCERIKAHRATAAKLAQEEELRLKRSREEIWGKQGQPSGEGVTAWSRGR